MKKIAIISLICITCISVHCQTNLSPTGSIFAQETTLSNAGNTIDGLTSTVANVPYTTSVTLTVKLDQEYHIGKIKLDANGTDIDLYHLFYSSTGDPWDFTPVKSYNDPPLDNTLDFNAQYVKLMIENSSTISQISIKEFEIYEYIPPVVFNYDASGNRISRTIELGGTKSGKIDDLDPEIFEEIVEETKFTIYPNPTDGLLQIDISNLDTETPSSIKIFDVQGRIVYENNTPGLTNSVDMSERKPGVYILMLQVGDKTREWKIIKE